MRFIFNLTRREIRSSWRRLLFFFLCIALGVGSVVALRSLIQNLTKVVGNDARALMTADVEVSSTNDFSPTDVSKIEGIIAGFPTVEARNETIRSGKPIVSSVFFAPALKKYAVTVGIPVIRNGEAAYYLAVGIPVDTFAQELQNTALPDQWVGRSPAVDP